MGRRGTCDDDEGWGGGVHVMMKDGKEGYM